MDRRESMKSRSIWSNGQVADVCFGNTAAIPVVSGGWYIVGFDSDGQIGLEML